MLHISSEDVQTGETFNGAFALSNQVSGSFKLTDFYIEAGDIPWIYAGANLLNLLRTSDSSPETVTFPETEDSTPAAVELVLEAAFDTVSFLAGTVVTFNSVTNAYDVVVSESVKLLWANSNSRSVFQKTVDEEGAAFSLSASFIDSRPKYIEFHIVETSTIGISSHSSSADLFLPTFDPLPPQAILTFSASHTTLDIEVRRVNVIQVPCPMRLKWDLLFIPSG